MTETEVQDYNAQLQKMLGNFQKNTLTIEKDSGETKIKSTESNADDKDQYIYESPFRSSDPTVIDRKRIIGFQKTGQLLRRIKRELSTKNFDMQSQQSRRTNKRISTQHSIGPKNCSRLNWNQNEKDEMQEAIMDDYEKQILTLKAQLQDIRQEKKQIKQTLQNQRRFFMAEMYSKEMIIQQNESQIEKLREQIEKHTSLEFQLQEKIRLLQLQNSQYQYQLQGMMDEQDYIEPINEENEDFLNDYIDETLQTKRKSNKLFASLGDTFGRSNFTQEETLERIKMIHQRQIEKYQKEIKNIRQFYEIKLRGIRNSMTPKIPQKKRVSINILDQYVCRDSMSCQSQGPRNLRSMLRQQMNFQNSGRKINDQQSFVTVKYFNYPEKTKKNLNGEEIFIRESQNHQNLQVSKLQFEQQQKDQSKIKQLLRNLTPSNEFLKGFGIGGLLIGIGTTFVYRNFGKK